MRPKSAGVVAALLVTAGMVPLSGPAVAALPACPEVYGHGGYPASGDTVALDQVRQPHHPRGLQAQSGWGADGVEADVQLTRDGTKAVMWHNTTTGKLTGSNNKITELWWATGGTMLSGRTIEVGPYAGETVYTLREWLNSAKANGLNAYLEVKGDARQSLLHSDAAIKARAWSELLAPVQERYAGQAITMYSNDTAVAAELNTRAAALGLSSVLVNRPKWTDSVAWQEPPLPAFGNEAKWASVLATGPSRVFTSYPREYRVWLTSQAGVGCSA
ncbi:hypothetical protein Ait01nite_058500 [Actinoplanes italicus]|uniref:Glycerophosphoryl diester phosphodiesterase n=1 Tax=Actinoplanes italicus TaxID=113567 RepID=A0A2T0K6H8_9ACTN|nr:glycerophosphodiester phosphodiesterase family protein [Actinoplanes italicus]PRX18396.1 glycerophosphoryl diester phosphodiesterase [Actinoplanes italicus]GIE32805.1 hypothetical protein Ait01nite_058500 [Actinoplanes italicus]